MKYRRCGKSGLLLPAISLGCWHNFGDINNFENSKAMVRKAFDLGITHFDLANNEWLYSKHDELIDRVMKEEHVGKCRLMLNLLLRQPFEEEFLHSDFIDFCVSKITACAQPYAIRAYCMKLAYEQMKYYPELLSELKMALDMLEQETRSPS